MFVYHKCAFYSHHLETSSTSYLLLPTVKLPTHLAYLDLFQSLTPAPNPNHCMYKVSWLSVQLNTQPSSSKFMRYYTGTSTCIPSWNSHPPDWTSDNVLELWTQFCTNPYSQMHVLYFRSTLISLLSNIISFQKYPQICYNFSKISVIMGVIENHVK